MIKVIRITRHPADDAQRAALEAAARTLVGDASGEVVVHQFADNVKDVGELVDMIQSEGYNVVEVVLPPNLIASLLSELQRRNLNIPVIRAITEREVGEDGNVVFRFVGYERLVRVVVETERII